MNKKFLSIAILIIMTYSFVAISTKPHELAASSGLSEGCQFLNTVDADEEVLGFGRGINTTLPFYEGEVISIRAYIELDIENAGFNYIYALTRVYHSSLIDGVSVYGGSGAAQTSTTIDDPQGKGHIGSLNRLGDATGVNFNDIQVLVYVVKDALYDIFTEVQFPVTDQPTEYDLSTLNYFIETSCGKSLDFPNLGLIQIDVSQTQAVYESASGGVIRNADGSELQIPQDYDGNGFDTFTITDFAEIDGQEWYAIWLGSESWGWVPAANVTRLE